MFQLQKIKRKDLDIKKYSKAIEKALNYRIYAEYWYLDVLTDEKWECWICGDYEVIMPIPLQYKFGIKFVLQPFYCQQLGVFYQNEIPDGLFKKFEEKLHQYKVRVYHFNEENTERYHPKGEKRVNHLLSLQRDYEEIQKKFRKDRLKDIRRNNKLNLILKEEFDFDLFFELRRKEYTELESISDLNLTKKFIKALLDSGKYLGYTLYNEQEQPLASCLFSQSKSRVILQFSARNKSIEPRGAATFMRSFIIEKLSNQGLFLDFEGSSIPGIADFNESLGAEKHYFTRFINVDSIKSFFKI